MDSVTISDADVDDIEAAVAACEGDVIHVMGVGISEGMVAMGLEIVRADGTVVDEVDIPDDVMLRLKSVAEAVSEGPVAARARWSAGVRPVAFSAVPQDDPLVTALRPVVSEAYGEMSVPEGSTVH